MCARRVLAVLGWLWVLGLILPEACAQFTDGMNVAFGKNRVQHRTFEWQVFEQGNFEVHHYREGDQIAGQVTRMLPREADALAPMFGRQLEGPLQVLVFNSQEEFRQSNVGVMLAQDEASNLGGSARLVGSKMFVYATGDRRSVTWQVREGLAHVLFNQTMYETDWSQAIRSGNVVQSPSWMSDGLARYAARGLDAASQESILDLCRRDAFRQLELASGKNAALLGQAMWSYVADIYGLPTVANVLYMTRVTQSVESGFRLATGSFLQDLALEVQAHHLRQAPEGYADMFPPFLDRKDMRRAGRSLGPGMPMRPVSRLSYTQFLPNRNGNLAAFTTDERGQLRVGTVDLESGERTWHITLGHRLDRLDNELHPRLAWGPEGQLLFFSVDLKGAPHLGTVNLGTGDVELKELFQIDQVLDMTCSPDGRFLLMSALQHGQSDLYRYDIVANNHTPLWRDRFDDLQPAFWPGSSTFIFSSNRPDDTLRNDRLDHPYPEALDLYVGDLAEDPITLTRWTATPNVDERHPEPLEGWEFLTVTTDDAGARGVGFGWRDSSIVAVDTVVRYRTFTQFRDALSLPVAGAMPVLDKNLSHVMASRGGRTQWTEVAMPDLSALHAAPSLVQEPSTPLPSPTELPSWERSWAEDEINFRTYVFEAEREETSDATPAQEEESVAKDHAPLTPKNSRLNFALDKIQTRLNNTFGSNFYQVYNGTVNAQPGLGNASELRISDVMDDKHIVGGYTIPANLSNTFFGLAYLDLERQVDRILSVERQTTARVDPQSGQLVETATHLLRREWRWAFDEVRSLRWGAAFRFNHDVVQGTDLFSATTPNGTGEQLGLQVAYVHDDTRSPRLNIRHGLRARVWAEMFVDGVATASAAGGELTGPDLGWTFGTVGFDARRYVPLVGPSILALRLAGDWSIGQRKLLHMLGGTDNSLSLQGNANTPVDPDIPFAYQARIAPLRGFQSNVRNGANVALANAEVRVPVFFSGAGRSDFLKHLQAVAFADVGAAWTGLHPYTDENSFNFVTVQSNPITVTVSNNREPVLYDLGFGLRSRLLGYWVAADWAYGVDDGITLPRRFTLSLNFDF